LVCRSYDKQFKFAAVKLVIEDELTIMEISKELSIDHNTLYRWINEYEEYE
jgi:transposase